MARDLLVEIGVEELPASFVTKALEAMPGLAQKLLESARLTHGEISAWGTPRRLALHVAGVSEAQPDVSEEMTGPPKSVAIDAEGKPTKAGEAFAKKHGKGPEALTVVTTPKGEYVAVRREEKGEAAAKVLPKVIEDLAGKIPFQKSMRWGAGEVAFGRPIHWLVVLFGNHVLPAKVAGVTAGRATRGHRFLSPASFDLAAPGDYLDALRKVHVLADPAERRRTMREGLLASAKDLGGELIDDDFLEGECASLVEEPHCVPGGFDPKHLELPEDVIVSVMRHHQRYFAVRDPASKRLLPRYLNVVNTAQDPGTIARGNDRVLRARLADARFFVEEDGKILLGDRLEKLKGVVFQNKLGTVAEKIDRVLSLALSLPSGADPTEVAVAAGLCKCDLVTLIVGEFPELQGAMGRWFALRQGITAEVADAIRDHYLPKGAGDSVARQPIAAAIAVADRADTLVGCFGIGQVPSGSADPFALRRAALGIVRTALEGPFDVDLRTVLAAAHAGYVEQGKKLKPEGEVLAALDEFFRARLRAFYGDRFRADLVDACLAAWSGTSLRDVHARVRAIDAFRALPAFDALAVAFKRTFNIAKDAPAGDVDPALLTEQAEKDLAERFRSLRPRLEEDISAGRYEPALLTVATDLKSPIDLFFEKVLVMHDDPAIRDNRLRLLGGIARTLTGVAHFHLIGGA